MRKLVIVLTLALALLAPVADKLLAEAPALAGVAVARDGTLAMVGQSGTKLRGQPGALADDTAQATRADFHGVTFDKPLTRLKESIHIIRALLAGEPVDFSGECFELRRFKLGFRAGLESLEAILDEVQRLLACCDHSR